MTEDVHEIINRAKEGNQIAFSRLLDRFWNDVYGFQLKRTENENDAEDITIQTFSKAFDKINTYDNRFAFKTWLITISKNIHIDLVRKRKKSLLDSRRNEDAIKSVYDESLTMEDQLIQEQNLADLLRDIKSLKPHYQEVINLRYFNELSYADIAEKLNEPINNIKVKILRAKKLLSEVIRNRR
ncbi:sigma-70 family RNA polymerase sigma factor [Maribacter sp. PR1]|uniref:Sigma-70 family RNA polymerase sigma factor n=1 Tax=Maribacter cobaltidurans TaxID=1178778 RepID=A0ABU7IXJ0_9FLAO|nr:MULTISPECIES: sigma-70 family RNA polymerase sigma factor [Maribacter]MDC6390158.1 sigma-70 family RNA polymerase sigma factor [Maribacter sp. PR1]MEE1977548.1 sigma-70 family RNA polymerase sigma factor [Maribacter cobaltidurans]